jgi:transglutaminase-like putative cysteine protease
MSNESRRPTDGGHESNRTRRDLLRGAAFGTGLALAGCLAGGERATRSPGSLSRRLEFTTGHRRETVRATVPTAVYERVDDATHSIAAAMAAARERDFLDRLAGELVARTNDRTSAILAAQSLASGIEYVTDPESVGRAEFVRYPAETLLDGEADCEDKAILLAGLLASEALDCRTALVLPRGHCATLVAREDLPADRLAADPLTVTLDGTTFVYVEAVSALAPGRAARDYGARRRLAAFTDRWHVLDPGAVVETVEQELGRRLRTLRRPENQT